MSRRRGPIEVHIHIYDDLIARTNHRQIKRTIPSHDRRLADLVRSIAERYKLDGHLAVTVRSEPVDLDEQPDRLLDDGDHVRIAPCSREISTGALIASLIIAAVSTGVSLLLAPSLKAAGTETSDEQRYGFNRLSNDAFAGDAVPVVFGRRRRYGGKVIAKVPGEGEDGDSRLKLLITFGHGPIQAIGNQEADADRVPADQLTGIFFNDQPIANFPGVTASIRRGNATQAVIPGFDDTETLHEVGVGGAPLENNSGFEVIGDDPGDDVVDYTTADPVDAVVLRVRLPRGLYKLGSSGQFDPTQVKYRYRTRLTDAGGGTPGPWSDWTTTRLTKALQSEFYSAPRIDGLGVGGVPERNDIQVERVSVEPTNAQIVDDLIWDSIVEVVDSFNTYDGHALLALELIASEQLQGVPRVSADVKGLANLRIWDGISDPGAPVYTTGYSDNPAWHALELLTNTTWGLGAIYGDGWIDTTSLIEWAQLCDEDVDLAGGAGTRKRFRFNYVLDHQMNGIDALRLICAAGRCTPVSAGRVWRFVADRQRDIAVEHFTDGSIAIDDAGVAIFEYTRELAIGGTTRPNRLVAQFENEYQDGRAEVVAWPAVGDLWLATEPTNEQHVRLDGVTNVEQVLSGLKYRMKRIRFLTRSVRFRTTVPVPAVLPGERFDLAMSMPGYGLASGRLMAGATETVVRLDRSITLAAGTTYTLRVLHMDNSVEVREIASPAGYYAAGSDIELLTPFSQAPAEFAEYVVGEPSIDVKPFLCTSVRPIDAGDLMWEIAGGEYAEDVYDDSVDSVDLPDYSTLNDGTTPPGPVISLRCFERSTGGTNHVVLSWNQEPADREITAAFRVYRRLSGTTAWVLIPTAVISQHQAILGEIGETDAGFEFIVVAVSYGGAYLSPYDPRHPRCSLVFGLGEPPPPPPDNPLATNTGDNTYTISWDAVDDAVGYQVLTGGDTGSTLPNDGTEGCLVLARVTDTELAGLELTPSQACDFWIRSVGSSGRLSWYENGTSGAAQVSVASPATPAGQTIKHTKTFDLSTEGTLSNLIWNATTSRLELVNAGADGVWTSPEVDTGSLSVTELTFRPGTANDADDPTLDTDPFAVPSVAADQWGVTDDPATGEVGMLMPPYPDDEQEFEFEIQTHNGMSWSGWQSIDVFASVSASLQKYQLRVMIRRKTAPYRPALRSMVGVATH